MCARGRRAPVNYLNDTVCIIFYCDFIYLSIISFSVRQRGNNIMYQTTRVSPSVPRVEQNVECSGRL